MSIRRILFSALLASVLFNSSVFAMDRDTLRQKYAEAKQSGLIGERQDGYLGIIKNQGDAAIIVERINNFRKKRYQEVSKESSLPLSEVEARAGQRLYEKAEPGSFILINGKWVKK